MISPTGVKLSDLNAVRQQNPTRAGVTLTGAGLTATAAGTIARLMPQFSDIAPVAYPVLVYFAAVSLPLAGFPAIATMPLIPELQASLVERLSTEAGHPDTVSPELQQLFVRDVDTNLRTLN